MLLREPERHAPPWTQTINGDRTLARGKWRSSFSECSPTRAYSMSRMTVHGSKSPASLPVPHSRNRKRKSLRCALLRFMHRIFRVRQDGAQAKLSYLSAQHLCFFLGELLQLFYYLSLNHWSELRD